MKLNKKTYYIIMLLLLFIVSQIFILNAVAQQLQISSNTQPQAVEYLQRAVNKMEEAIKAYEGVNYPSKTLWAEAIKYGEKAFEIDPDFVEAHYYLALMFQYTNWYSREAREWEKYIELIQQQGVISPEAKQNLAHAYYRLGYNSYQKGDYEQSLTYILNSIKEYPDLIDSNYWAARVFYETGDYNQAIRYYREVLNLQPDNAEASYWLKESQRRLGAKQ